MKSLFLWLQIRALEAFAQGQQDTLPLVSDVETHTRLRMKHAALLAEITVLKAQYRRLKRGPGVQSWRSA